MKLGDKLASVKKSASEAATKAAAKAKSLKDSVVYSDSLQIIREIDEKLKTSPEDLFKLSNLKSIFGNGRRSMLRRMLRFTPPLDPFRTVGTNLQNAYKVLKWDHIVEVAEAEKDKQGDQQVKIQQAIEEIRKADGVLKELNDKLNKIKFVESDKVFKEYKKSWMKYVAADTISDAGGNISDLMTFPTAVAGGVAIGSAFVPAVGWTVTIVAGAITIVTGVIALVGAAVSIIAHLIKKRFLSNRGQKNA